MLFVLPDEGRFDEVEAALDSGMLADIRTGLASADVILKLPRFAFDAAYDVVPALEALGVSSAFGPGADFSRMSSDPLFLSDVRHGAFISVTEEGVEAGAVSTFAASAGTSPPPVYLTLDRPFMFVIEDLPTGQILFVGRLNNPR